LLTADTAPRRSNYERRCQNQNEVGSVWSLDSRLGYD
jgi:hypothetical protein